MIPNLLPKLSNAVDAWMLGGAWSVQMVDRKGVDYDITSTLGLYLINWRMELNLTLMR